MYLTFHLFRPKKKKSIKLKKSEKEKPDDQTQFDFTGSEATKVEKHCCKGSPSVSDNNIDEAAASELNKHVKGPSVKKQFDHCRFSD